MGKIQIRWKINVPLIRDEFDMIIITELAMNHGTYLQVCESKWKTAYTWGRPKDLVDSREVQFNKQLQIILY